MKKARAGEFWDLMLTVDLKAKTTGLRVTYVQAWAGVESVFEDEGREMVVWLPRRRLGEPHEVVTTEAKARTLAKKDGEASGLPHWTESKR